MIQLSSLRMAGTFGDNAETIARAHGRVKGAETESWGALGAVINLH